MNKILLGCMCISVAVPALALPPAAVPEPIERNSLTIGAGAAYLPSYEGSDDYKIVPAIQARGEVAGHDFSLLGSTFLFDLIPHGRPGGVHLSLGPAASLDLNRTGGIKDPQVKALGKLDTAIELGGYVGISKTGVITSPYDTLALTVSYLHDVSGVSHSWIVTPTLTYATPLSVTTFVALSGSATITGDRYARTYFGVTPAGAAASGLPAFTPDGGMKNVRLTLLGGKSLSGDIRHGFAIFAAASYERLLNDYADSPIVSVAGSRNQWVGALGLGYTF